MVVAAHVFGIIGTIFGGFASFYLAFGFTRYIKNEPYVLSGSPSKFWVFLGLDTIEKVKKCIYILLGTGFAFLLISQILTCFI